MGINSLATFSFDIPRFVLLTHMREYQKKKEGGSFFISGIEISTKPQLLYIQCKHTN